MSTTKNEQAMKLTLKEKKILERLSFSVDLMLFLPVFRLRCTIFVEFQLFFYIINYYIEFLRLYRYKS